MEIFIVLLVLLGVAAFFISMSNRSRIQELEDKVFNIELERSKVKKDVPVSVKVEVKIAPEEKKIESLTPIIRDAVVAKPVELKPEIKEVPKQEPIKVEPVEHVIKIEAKVEPPQQKASIEQIIGTRWVLIAGIISVIVGMGFFLKYAYDNAIIGPVGRVIVVTIAGLAALIIGEVTRRRGYEIVARGMTALGFAILYVADFSAYRLYDLIGSVPAFGAAIIITAGAMAYAVGLNEILIAFLSLLGGYITPVLLSSGDNQPVPLFGYLTVLSVGAMLCAIYRKWRVVNILCFIGTYGLYTGWFENFYRYTIKAYSVPEQMHIALGGLVVFFLIYLLLPILFSLVRKQKAKSEDVLLVMANALAVFYYLWNILSYHHKTALALSCAGLFVVYMILLAVTHKRCGDDVNLKISILAIGLFFLTVAIPLYFKMYAMAIAWSAEGVILSFVALRYKNVLVQIAAIAALVLSVSKLVFELPMHESYFRLIFNPQFASWLFVAAMFYVVHLIYRKSSFLNKGIASQLMFCAGGFILMVGSIVEWSQFCNYRDDCGCFRNDLWANISLGVMIIFAAVALLFILKGFSPCQGITNTVGTLLIIPGIMSFLFALTLLHDDKFVIFGNLRFWLLIIFALAVSIYHMKFRIASVENKALSVLSQILFGTVGLLIFAAVACEWYSNCRLNLERYRNSDFLCGFLVIISVISSLFITKPICPKGPIARRVGMLLLFVGIMVFAFSTLSLHEGSFLFIFNIKFLVLLIFAASVAYYHINYRNEYKDVYDFQSTVSQFLYGLLGAILISACAAEWYWNCRLNAAEFSENNFVRGLMLILSIFMILFVLKPLRPAGIGPTICSAILAAAGSALIATSLLELHNGTFKLFANIDFAIAALFIASVFAAARLIYLNKEIEFSKYMASILSLAALFVLWILITEEIYAYWHCKSLYAEKIPNWKFLATMYISISWAVYGIILMIIGFWRKLAAVRYVSLGIFAILLLKVFIMDMAEVKSVYRIAAFLATGVTLVTVSYLYQYLKKKGFFDNLMIDSEKKNM